MTSAEYDESKSNGYAWDNGLGGYRRPDPYVVINVDGERVGATRTAHDTLHPEWDDTFTVQLSGVSRLTFVFMDEDIVNDDRAGEYTVEDLGAAIASGGRSERISAGSVLEVSFTLEPR